jgi:DNA polymerase-4
VLQLTEHVGRRLRRDGLSGRTIQIKVRYNDFHTVTRAKSLPEPTDSTDTIWQIASQLLATKLPRRKLSIRLLGVGVAKLQQAEAPAAEEQTPRSSRLDTVTDQITDRFGASAVRRGINPKQ